MSKDIPQIILATHNTHKAEEIEQILKGQFKVRTMKDMGVTGELEETGSTIEENAEMKAEQLKCKLGDMPVIILSDDTGLFVDALNGAPGVYSARYAGEDVSYEDNNKKLLLELDGVDDRKAEFKTCFCAIFPDGAVTTATGEVKGKIAHENQGDNGFGYDPLFIPEGYEKTYAQMTDEEKNKLSHRKAGLDRMIPILETYLQESRSRS